MAHDRNMLVLLYRLVFSEEYPSNDFDIEIDPGRRPVQELPYLPDILISRNGALVKWVEVGKLSYQKGAALVKYLEKDCFCHVPYDHDVFQLNEAKSDILTSEKSGSFDLLAGTQMQEIDTIKEALTFNHYHLQKTAKFLSLTFRQLRYRIAKYGLRDWVKQKRGLRG